VSETPRCTNFGSLDGPQYSSGRIPLGILGRNPALDDPPPPTHSPGLLGLTIEGMALEEDTPRDGHSSTSSDLVRPTLQCERTASGKAFSSRLPAWRLDTVGDGGGAGGRLTNWRSVIRTDIAALRLHAPGEGSLAPQDPLTRLLSGAVTRSQVGGVLKPRQPPSQDAARWAFSPPSMRGVRRRRAAALALSRDRSSTTIGATWWYARRLRHHRGFRYPSPFRGPRRTRFQSERQSRNRRNQTRKG
jgi:hypothetical protein